MNNNETLYSRLTSTSADWCYVCDEWMWKCPDCGASLCVTCMDECTMCETPLF